MMAGSKSDPVNYSFGLRQGGVYGNIEFAGGLRSFEQVIESIGDKIIAEFTYETTGGMNLTDAQIGAAVFGKDLNPFLGSAYGKEVHDEIIDWSFPGLTDEERGYIKAGSAEVDSLPNQTAEMSYKHAMLAPGGNFWVGLLKTVWFMYTMCLEARRAQSEFERAGGEGWSPEALRLIGQATHPATDMTSPAHRGFQEWHGLGGLNSLRVPRHVMREAGITPENLHEAVNGAHTVFLLAFGSKAYKQAITPH